MFWGPKKLEGGALGTPRNAFSGPTRSRAFWGIPSYLHVEYNVSRNPMSREGLGGFSWDSSGVQGVLGSMGFESMLLRIENLQLHES